MYSKIIFLLGVKVLPPSIQMCMRCSTCSCFWFLQNPKNGHNPVKNDVNYCFFMNISNCFITCLTSNPVHTMIKRSDSNKTFSKSTCPSQNVEAKKALGKV